MAVEAVRPANTGESLNARTGGDMAAFSSRKRSE